MGRRGDVPIGPPSVPLPLPLGPQPVSLLLLSVYVSILSPKSGSSGVNVPFHPCLPGDPRRETVGRANPQWRTDLVTSLLPSRTRGWVRGHGDSHFPPRGSSSGPNPPEQKNRSFTMSWSVVIPYVPLWGLGSGRETYLQSWGFRGWSPTYSPLSPGGSVEVSRHCS